MSGYYFLSLASPYVPDPQLVAFIEAGEPPVYIGFGSIVVENPDATTKLIFDAVKKAGVRALVAKGWGGFGGDETSLPVNTYMLGNVPHDYLFKHVSAVVHHGGAGTTAAGILAGKPTVVVPFFGDQPFWGAVCTPPYGLSVSGFVVPSFPLTITNLDIQMIARVGAGPEPIPFKNLASGLLAAAILKALTPEVLQKAQRLGHRIAKEDGAAAGAKSFHAMLDIAKHRCSVSPSRVAVCRLRKTNIRLSNLAAIVLGDEGLIKSSDLKLYRPCEYDVEDGPWDPLTGGASALLGTLTSLMIGVADIPVEIMSGVKTSVQKSVLQRAEKERMGSAATSPASSTPSLGLNLSVKSSVESVVSPDTAITVNPPGSDPTAKATPKSPTAPIVNASKRAHTISLNSIISPKHTHTLTASSSSQKATLRAETGASYLTSTVLRPAMDITLSIARGFHSAPKLYGDTTVREPSKVTDFRSGVAAAGREFAFGWYDGLSGLVMQPVDGVKRNGARGFLEGIGRGFWGAILKPGSGMC